LDHVLPAQRQVVVGVVPVGYKVSLVNAFVSYKRYCELKGVAVKWTHHDWNKVIGYAHVDPNKYWLQRKSPPKSIPEVNAKKICQRIDTQALSPTRGWLRDRLAPINHMPVMASGTHVCQLH
jgi:hypothetical protein